MLKKILLLNLRRRIPAILLAAVASGLWTLSLLASQNILFYNRDWKPFSVSFNRMMIAGYDTLLGRQHVAYGDLYIRKYGMRLRVMSRREWDPGTIRFKALIRQNGYITVMTTPDGNNFTALRLSANSILRSQFYKFDFHEAHSEVKPFWLDLTEEAATEIEIRNGERMISVFADGKKLGEIEGHFPRGYLGLEVTDSTTITDPEVSEGETVYELPFRRDRYLQWFALNLILFSLIALALPVRVMAGIALGGLLWLSFDFTISRRRLFLWNHGTFTFEPAVEAPFHVEDAANRFFGHWYSLLGGKVFPTKKTVEAEVGPIGAYFPYRWSRNAGVEELPQLPESFPSAVPGVKRMLLIGGSMDSGFGTTGIREAYDVKLQRLLGKIEILNASKGAVLKKESKDSAELLRVIDVFRPDVILIDLHLNFLDRNILSRFMREVRKRSARVIFSRPPFNLTAFHEKGFDLIAAYVWRPVGSENFPQMRYFRFEDQLARFLEKESVPFIETNRAFLVKAEHAKASLFWDNVHLTDAGHTLMADFLAKELVRLSVFPAP